MPFPSINQAPTPMLKQYLEIKAQHMDAILFYRLGDFYEMFYDDALVASKVLDITLTARNKNDPVPVPLCGVPFHSVEPYLAKLLEKGYRVAICEQVEDAATAQGVVKREVTRVLTPGVVVESTHLDAKRNNYLASVISENAEYGLAFSDISTGVFLASSARNFFALLQELARFEPREILLPDTFPPNQLELLKQNVKTLITVRSHKTFRSPQLEQFPGSKEVKQESELALEAASAIWNYFTETQKHEVKHLHRLQLLSSRGEMRLDHATRRNLELVESLHEGERWGTLLWLLDRCETSMGSRLLRSWILSPLTERDQITARHHAIEQLLAQPELLLRLREILAQVYDLERINSRVVMNVANARDLLALANSLERLPELQRMLVNSTGRLHELISNLDLLSDLRAQIVDRISPEPPLGLRDGNLIRTGFSSELDKLQSLSHSGKEFISRLEAEEKAKTGINKLKVGFNRVFGYYIEVGHLHKDKVPQHYIRKQTLSNCERFITPELKTYEEKVLGAEEKAKALEYALFLELREVVGQAQQRIQHTAQVLSELDVYLALATVACEQRFVKPELVDEAVLEFVEARHPIVACMSKERFVPNDLSLGEQHGTLALITGPNMAGKSTVMRQTALIVLIAQLGSFVPAQSARLGIVDRIFTRVGAADALALGQSTFMVEMAETAVILHQATDRSLVLIDEIGRGTSTFDGLAIAWAVAEDLHDRIRARTLFATHYHELSALAQNKFSVRNYHMAVHEENGKIIFLRKFLPGNTSHSYGIHVAQLAGIPQSVLGRAQEVLLQLEQVAPEARGKNKKDQSSKSQYQLFQKDSVHDRQDS